MTTEQVGATLATLRTLVQATPPPTEVASLHDWMDTLLRNSGDSLPKLIVAGVSRLLDRLPPGDALCHCDLHPGNVIMTAEGPRLIDWMGAKRADAAVDLGCCQVLLCDMVPEILGERERQRALNAALQSEYARQVGMSSAALTAAIEPYLPIIRVLVLIIVALRPATRERLIHRVEADLRAAK
jgi:Ser/Thr protein kinase RdoA (MazF antagonist)